MESFFRKVSSLSATFILILLSAIFVVLFLYAKPAIKEYGLHFVVDPRWGVTLQTSAQEFDKSANNTTNKVTDNEIPTDNEDVAIPQDNEDISIPQDKEDIAIPQDNDDISIPQDSDDLSVSQDEDIGASSNVKTIYGGLIPIVGTILSTILAMIFAVPIAMGIAIFLSEIAPPFIAKPVGIAIELLAAIPSIIYGMWGLFYFGPLVADMFGGSSVSLLVAGMVLAVMIIPFMASLTRDSMNTTPNVLKESAYAMGATKFEVIKDVIFPYAKKGIIGSMILALGRALGETMAVAFVIGGVFSFPHKLTDPTVSIPVVLANNFAESSGMSLSALFYLALILFVISFAVISFAKFYFLREKR
ncbi:phosphate ABC transporter permease subunit PstC [Nautilia lithotrophica]